MEALVELGGDLRNRAKYNADGGLVEHAVICGAGFVIDTKGLFRDRFRIAVVVPLYSWCNFTVSRFVRKSGADIPGFDIVIRIQADIVDRRGSAGILEKSAKLVRIRLAAGNHLNNRLRITLRLMGRTPIFGSQR